MKKHKLCKLCRAGVINPVYKAHNPARFSVLPGRPPPTGITVYFKKAVVYLVGQKTRQDYEPRRPGLTTPVR